MESWIRERCGKGVICMNVESLRGLESIHYNNQPVVLPYYFSIILTQVDLLLQKAGCIQQLGLFQVVE